MDALSTHSAKIEQRRPIISGKEISDSLLERYAEAYPQDFPFRDGERQSEIAQHKWRMFCEMVARHAFDVAGNRYSRDYEDNTRYSSFDTLFEELAKKGITGEKAFDLVLSRLPSYSKGIVQTPHPTEVLGHDALAADQDLHDMLENHATMINGKFDRRADITAVLTKMKELYDHLQPPMEPLTTGEEMARSILFSERMFDSIPIIMQSVLDAAKRHGAYDGGKLTDDQLMAFNFLLEPETWSPGDRDSKPDVTADVLQEGVEMNRRNMQLHYMKKLAEIIADPQTSDTAKDKDRERPVKARLRKVLGKIMAGISSKKIDEYLKGEHRPSEGACGEIAKQQHMESKPAPYVDALEFIAALESIRQTPNAAFAPYRFGDRGHSDVDALDALITQANNFGMSALRSQIRENSKMHAEAMEQVLALLKKKELIPEAVDLKEIKAFHHRPALDKAQEERAINMTRQAIDALMRENPAKPGIHAVLDRHLQDIKPLVDNAKDKRGKMAALVQREKRGEHISEEEKQRVELTQGEKTSLNVYETLKGFEIAAKHPEIMQRYLIAECHSANDMLEAFFMLKAMQPGEMRHRTGYPGTEIVPLVEYRDDVARVPEMMVQAFADPHFARHHYALTAPDDPRIAVPLENAKAQRSILAPQDPLGLERAVLQPLTQKMTVAEAKRMYQLEIRKGDEKKEIVAAKVSMFAGSDITKSVGCAGAGMVLHATQELRQKMLDMDKPVLLIDYTGSGGGIHRSQPVATPFETVQGRSLRQGPGNIAQKFLQLAGRFLQKMLGLADPEDLPHFINGKDPSTHVLAAQLNMGNIAGLPYREDLWKAETEARLNADMDKYEKLYQAPEYSAYMEFTADPFVKLTSYAARPPGRIGSQGMDVKKLRAIGYGAALNASGSCASYYYGASEFLHLDGQGRIPRAEKDKLVELYLHDPIAQDRINRATYGIAMANMDTAWDYLGCKRQVGEDGTVTYSGDEPADAKQAQARQVLERIDKEYQRVSRGLVELHRAAKAWGVVQDKERDEGRPLPELQRDKIARTVDGATQKTGERLRAALPQLEVSQARLLALLPGMLSEQMVESRKQMDPARQCLAPMFRDILANPAGMPVRAQDNEAYKKVYYTMGTAFETFENSPRAYTRLRWAIDNEHRDVKRQGAGLALAL